MPAAPLKTALMRSKSQCQSKLVRSIPQLSIRSQCWQKLKSAEASFMMSSVAHAEQQHNRAVETDTPSEGSCGRLQGIALSADPNYKVLGSAYPWIARRLLSDNSPDLQETLRALLYKGNKFQFARLESLLRQAVKSPPRTNVDSSSRPNRQVSPGVVSAAVLCSFLPTQPRGTHIVARIILEPSLQQLVQILPCPSD